MAGAWLAQALAAMTSKKKVLANVIGSVVCAIALVHYVFMCIYPKRQLDLRYSDWMCTCALLIVELGLLMEVDPRGIVVSTVLVWIMLACGYTNRPVLFWVGCACLLLTVLVMMFGARELHVFGWAFFLLWALYPLAYGLVRGVARERSLDLLDALHRAVDLGRADAHAARVQHGVGAPVDQHAAARRDLDEVAVVPDAGVALEVGRAVARAVGHVQDLEGPA